MKKNCNHEWEYPQNQGQWRRCKKCGLEQRQIRLYDWENVTPPNNEGG